MAAGAGAFARVQSLLSQGASVNASDPKTGQTALHRAALSCSEASARTIKLLLASGGDPAIKDRGGQARLAAPGARGARARARSSGNCKGRSQQTPPSQFMAVAPPPLVAWRPELTPLGLALTRQEFQLEKVKALLSKGAAAADCPPRARRPRRAASSPPTSPFPSPPPPPHPHLPPPRLPRRARRLSPAAFGRAPTSPLPPRSRRLCACCKPSAPCLLRMWRRASPS